MTDLATGHVIAGAWDDAEWRAAAAVRNKRKLTAQEADLFAHGPREHPFGPLAHVAEYDGRALIFPSEAAHDEWVAQHGKPATE